MAKRRNDESGTVEALIHKTDKEKPAKQDIVNLREAMEKTVRLFEANALTEMAFNRLFRSISPAPAFQKILGRSRTEKRKELGYEHANVFVRMLIDQVVLCDMRSNHLEAVYSVELDGQHGREDGIYWDKRLSSAQRRFFRACRALARVTKLMSQAELQKEQAKNKRRRNMVEPERLCKLTSEAE